MIPEVCVEDGLWMGIPFRMLNQDSGSGGGGGGFKSSPFIFAAKEIRRGTSFPKVL